MCSYNLKTTENVSEYFFKVFFLAETAQIYCAVFIKHLNCNVKN